MYYYLTKGDNFLGVKAEINSGRLHSIQIKSQNDIERDEIEELMAEMRSLDAPMTLPTPTPKYILPTEPTQKSKFEFIVPAVEPPSMPIGRIRYRSVNRIPQPPSKPMLPNIIRRPVGNIKGQIAMPKPII